MDEKNAWSEEYAGFIHKQACGIQIERELRGIAAHVPPKVFHAAGKVFHPWKT